MNMWKLLCPSSDKTAIDFFFFLNQLQNNYTIKLGDSFMMQLNTPSKILNRNKKNLPYN